MGNANVVEGRWDKGEKCDSFSQNMEQQQVDYLGETYILRFTRTEVETFSGAAVDKNSIYQLISWMFFDESK